MPCIRLTVNQKLSNKNKNVLRDGIIDAITLIPGKTPSSVMVILDENKDMYFHESDDIKIAYVEINVLLRKDPSESYPQITAKICELLSSELGIPGENVYLRYMATPDWGSNGRNF